MRTVIAVPLLSLVVLCVPRAERAEACSPLISEQHSVDEDEALLDSEVPAISAASFRVSRFDEGGGCLGATSCDGQALLRIDIEASDNRSALHELGFDIQIVSGDLTLTFPATAVRSVSSSSSVAELSFGWPSDVAESALVQITPIDLAGNVGEPITLEIDDPGLDSGGCSAGSRGGRSGTPILFALALFAVVRRRRDPQTRC